MTVNLSNTLFKFILAVTYLGGSRGGHLRFKKILPNVLVFYSCPSKYLYPKGKSKINFIRSYDII